MATTSASPAPTKKTSRSGWGGIQLRPAAMTDTSHPIHGCEEAASLKLHLSINTLKDVFDDQEVLTVLDTDSIRETLDKLSTAGVRSAPVSKATDPSTAGPVSLKKAMDVVWDVKAYSVVGLVDTVDLVFKVLLDTTWREEDGDAHSESLLDKILRPAVDFFSPPVRTGKAINVSHEDPMTFLGRDAPVMDALVVFAMGLHRCIVLDDVDAPTRIVRVLSQSDLVRVLANKYLADHPAFFTAFKVRDVGMAHELVTCSTTSTAADAFEAMLAAKLRSIAVVNDAGELVDNLSASDIRLMGHKTKVSRWKEVLKGTVQDFLAAVRGKGRSLVRANPDSDLGQVLRLLADARVTRAWVVDDAGKPIGVVAHTDILHAVMAAVSVDPPELLAVGGK